MPLNILNIVIDDLTSDWELSACGVAPIMPNIAALRASATNFDRCYAHISVCNASRTATMTGLSSAESLVQYNNQSMFDYIKPRQTILARMRSAGYHVELAGKIFHAPFPYPAELERLYLDAPAGFPYSEGPLSGVSFVDKGGGFQTYAYDNSGEQYFYDRQVSNYGINFLNTYAGPQPFMLNLGFHHPHAGYQCPAKHYDAYAGMPDAVTFPANWATDPGDLPSFVQQYLRNSQNENPAEAGLPQWKATIWGYLASMTHVDYELGRFLDAFNASPYAANTVIVLWSDNGFTLGDKDQFAKFDLWESGCRVPAMIKAPGASPANITTPVSLMDITPTFCAIAGIAPPTSHGQSLLPLVNGVAGYNNVPQLSVWYGGSGSIVSADGNYRFIRYLDNSEELYDIATDEQCITNLASHSDQASRLATMRADLDTAMALYGFDIAGGTMAGDAGRQAMIRRSGTATLAGGGGDDQYFVSDVSTIVEKPGGGVDTLWFAGFTDASKGLEVDVPANVEIVRQAMFGHRAPGNANQKLLVLRAHNSGVTMDLTGLLTEMHGGAGNDTLLRSGPHKATTYGGDGDDIIQGGDAGDTLNGDAGNDRIYGGAGDDTINGGAGADQIWGDATFAQDAEDTSVGSGADTIDGGGGGDTVHAGGGADRITVRGGDTIWGEAGTDRFTVKRNSRPATIMDFAAGETIDVTDWAGVPVVTQSSADVLVRLGANSLVVKAATAANVTTALVHA